VRDSTWIYENIYLEHEELFRKIEEALGFKLFLWQKYFILTGRFRRYGKTTAEILRELLNVDGVPIDYRCRPRDMKEKIYREETKKIQKKLKEAGIKTRIVFWDNADKRRYEET